MSDPDVTDTLGVVTSGTVQSGWRLLTEDDSTELYALDGRLTSITDRAGNVTTLAYDASKRLSTVTGPFGHRLTFAYNTNGRVATVRLPDAGILTYSYDTNDNLITVTYPDRSVRRYVYNEQANTENTNVPHALTGIIDEAGNRFATYKYDAQGRAVSSEHAGGAEKVSIAYNSDGTASVTNARGQVHGYTFDTQYGLTKPTAVTGAPIQTTGGKALTYDSNGFLASRTDWNGNLTTYVHDVRGLETSRTEASGTPLARTITTQWHPRFHLPTRITVPSGVAGVNRVTTLAYDAVRGTLLTKTITAGTQTRTWTYTYNTRGQVLTENGPRTDVTDLTKYTYGATGNLATITNALNKVTKITRYDADGRPLSIQDPNGLITTLTYNARGQVSSRTLGKEVTRYAYYPTGQIQKVMLPDGSFLVYTYNAAHQLTRVSDAPGNHIDYTLDAMGNVTREQVFDAGGTLARTRSHAYDAVDRLVSDIGSRSQTTIYDRAANGDLIGVTDPLGNVTRNGFDALNRLVTSIDPDHGLTRIAYNADESVARVTDPRGLVTSYGYDGLGNQVSVQSPDGGRTTRTFDAAGNPITSTDARGKTTTIAYDALNRPTKQTFADASLVTYTYDQGTNGSGHLTGMTDLSGTTTWQFDQRGHVLQARRKIGTVMLTTTHTYDAVTGKLTATTLPSGRKLAFAYDALSRLPSAITVAGPPLISRIKFQPFGAVAAWDQGVGGVSLFHQRVRDADGQLTQVGFGNTAVSGGQAIVNTFNAASRIIRIADTAGAAKTFGYDPVDRLETYTFGVDDAMFTFDANGNRIGSSGTGGTTNWAIDAASNRLLRLTGALTQTNVYDAAGNLTSDGTNIYTYDARGKLVTASRTGMTASYVYNGLNERVKKSGTPGTTLFVQDGAKLIGEYTATGTAIQETVYLGDLPVAVLRPRAQYYVNPDHLGAPRTITNTTGKPVWTWDHVPFGGTAPNQNPAGVGTFVYNLRFPGQYYDSETGLFHNNARDYDPARGRYIQSDPIGLEGGINPYAYVGQSPLDRVDPTGLDLSDAVRKVNMTMTVFDGISEGLVSKNEPYVDEFLWSPFDLRKMLARVSYGVKKLACNVLSSPSPEDTPFPLPEEWKNLQDRRVDLARRSGESFIPSIYEVELDTWNKAREKDAIESGKSYIPMPLF